MSIECLPFDPSRCSLGGTGRWPVAERHKPVNTRTGPGTGRLSSQRRLDANRRNALRSTGPRTPQGKKRSSRNALKHGLCAEFAHLPGECAATFSIFIEELREQFQPRSIMQKTLFPQIADLIWRMNRMPEAQTKIFAEELDKAHRPGDAPLASSDVLARRFSDDPNRNGFLLLGRYERGMQNQLLRLLRQYEKETKQRPQTPYDPARRPSRAKETSPHGRRRRPRRSAASLRRGKINYRPEDGPAPLTAPLSAPRFAPRKTSPSGARRRMTPNEPNPTHRETRLAHQKRIIPARRPARR